MGDTGPQGLPGNDGAPGSMGDTGPTGPQGATTYTGTSYRDISIISYNQSNGTVYRTFSNTATVNGFTNFNELSSILNVPGVNVTYISIIYAFSGTPADTTLNIGFVDMSTGVIDGTTFPENGTGVSTDIDNPSILEYNFTSAISTETARCIRLAIWGGSLSISDYINIRTVVISFN